MADIKLFRINDVVEEIQGTSAFLEKSFQNLIEKNLDVFLGIQFLASEYSTGKQHGGRIDTLGLDEIGCPVIIEYKRTLNENVINQGLFYLDWLMDHKGEFELFVLNTFGKEKSKMIEWGSPRLLCIAGDFTKYDEHAVQQINRNIELIRYRKYNEDFILFELVNAVSTDMSDTITVSESAKERAKKPKSRNRSGKDHSEAANDKVYKSVTQYLKQSSPFLQNLFEDLKNNILALGDDVQMKVLKHYIAFKRIRSFASVQIQPQIETMRLYLSIDPQKEELVQGFTRDVSDIGHLGLGNFEIRIKNSDDLEKIKPLLVKSYNGE